MEITKIKYFKAVCPECCEEHIVNLKLFTNPPQCYKCATPLDAYDIDMKKVKEFNVILQEFTQHHKLETDTDGLVVSKHFDPSHGITHVV
jgi:hypothetical protein